MQSLSPQERACPHWLPGVLVGLCAAQPLLDVLSFWTQDLAWGSKLTLSLRLLIFLGVMLTGFVLSERRRFYWIAAAVCAALLCGARAGVPARQRSIHDREPDLRRDQLHPLRAACRCLRSLLSHSCAAAGKALPAWSAGSPSPSGSSPTVALLSALTGTNPVYVSGQAHRPVRVVLLCQQPERDFVDARAARAVSGTAPAGRSGAGCPSPSSASRNYSALRHVWPICPCS